MKKIEIMKKHKKGIYHYQKLTFITIWSNFVNILNISIFKLNSNNKSLED